MKYNFDSFYENDTVESVAFTLVDENQAAISLTGCAIEMNIARKGYNEALVKLDLGNGLSLTATPGQFRFDKQKLELKTGDYEYQIKISYPNSDDFTTLTGFMTILKTIK